MGSPLRLLIVEDSEDDADLVLLHLRRSGYDVTAHRVYSPEGMAAALAGEPWDVVIADYSLPQFNGLAALHMLRQKSPDLPFILVSGSIGDELAVAAMKAGADDYLTKEGLTRLGQVVRRELREAEDRRARRRAEQDLHRAHAELELRVEERTRELRSIADRLSDANEALGAEVMRREQIESELRKVNEVAKAASAAANQATQAKSEFLANMSHEIRTPMTAIIGYLDLLLDAGQSEASRADYVQTIRRNANHLLTIIDDILDISKIEAGKLEIERVTCSPAQIVADVMSLLRGRALDKGLELDLIFHAPFPAQIQSDPTRLRQILINLLGNALKFTDRGAVRFEVITRAANQQMQFAIADTGIGMTPEALSRVFAPYGQADTSTTRRFGGTGLGLTICKNLAERLRGNITVESTCGKGSTFTLTIDTGPLSGIPMLSAFNEALAPAQPDPISTIKLSGTILLADDAPHNRQLFSYYLSKAGAEVIAVENGLVACERAAESQRLGKPFDLIIMDMQMPQLDGYNATARLRAEGHTCPILALTANAMAGDRERCIRSGCNEHLGKPVDRAKLLRTVATYLSARKDATAGPVAGLPAARRVRSTLTGEPELEKFLQEFIRSLPGTITQLEALLNEQNVRQLREVLHELKGTAGVFGFPQITELAHAAQQQIDAHDAFQDIQAGVDALIGLIHDAIGSNVSSRARLT
jgi:signal transduction histidine kinase/HPt (histidine-containing phosphotransfer) domain-containing protein